MLFLVSMTLVAMCMIMPFLLVLRFNFWLSNDDKSILKEFSHLFSFELSGFRGFLKTAGVFITVSLSSRLGIFLLIFLLISGLVIFVSFLSISIVSFLVLSFVSSVVVKLSSSSSSSSSSPFTSSIIIWSSFLFVFCFFSSFDIIAIWFFLRGFFRNCYRDWNLFWNLLTLFTLRFLHFFSRSWLFHLLILFDNNFFNRV